MNAKNQTYLDRRWETMNIILAGIIGRYPYGGVAWCSLMYLLGLRQLGHTVWYLEDTGECNYDPIKNTISTDPGYAIEFIRSCLQQFGMDNRWCYIDYTGRYHGHTRESWLKICQDADIFINLSGGCWFWRDEYARIPYSAFIDSDPAFTQLAIAEGVSWYVDFFSRFNRLFTFGSNIGTPYSPVPVAPFHWEHTWQPVSLAHWAPDTEVTRPYFTTVMTWKIKSFAEIGGNKDQEFLKIIALPSITRVQLELAVNGPKEFLEQYGWHCRDAYAVSCDLNMYRKYLRTSLGEFSVAKHTYVQTNSGWFSDRTECYLAAGRPAVVQDTGFSVHLPVGEGLLAFHTIDEARVMLESVVTDYPRHARAAREIAVEYFAAERVLSALLERITG